MGTATSSPSLRSPDARYHQRHDRTPWLPAAAAMFVAGWGANQFTPLLVDYRTHAGLSAVTIDAIFGVYILGVVPGLLLGAAASDRRGRRIVRPFLALSALASAVLAAEPLTQVALYAGRLLTGVATGVILTAGTTWVKELSSPPWAPHGDASVGTRRAALALSGGFGLGALAAGALAQWLPHPLVTPYLVHILLAMGVLPLLRRVPETTSAPYDAVPGRGAEPTDGRWTRIVSHPRFLRVVLPMSPAVFCAAAVAYAVMPSLVIDQTSGFAPLFSGAVTGVTLATGIAVQPLTKRFHRATSARATIISLGVVVVGLVAATGSAAEDSATLVLPTAALLGAGYGLALTAGLMEVQRIATPSGLATLTATYYSATYTGFATPVLLALAAGAVSYPVLLLSLALVTVLCLSIAATYSRRHLPQPTSDSPAS